MATKHYYHNHYSEISDKTFCCVCTPRTVVEAGKAACRKTAQSVLSSPSTPILANTLPREANGSCPMGYAGFKGGPRCTVERWLVPIATRHREGQAGGALVLKNNQIRETKQNLQTARIITYEALSWSSVLCYYTFSV